MLPNSEKYQPSTAHSKELCGFVCPDCLISLDSADSLVQHFESKHGDKAEPTSPEKRNPILTDERDRLVSELSGHNNILLKRLSEDQQLIHQLQCILQFVTEGTPLPVDFSFSNKVLESHVNRFIGSQAERATTDSVVEALREELKTMENHVHDLEGQLEKAQSSKCQILKQTAEENETLKNELRISEEKLQSTSDDVRNLTCQIESLQLERAYQQSIEAQNPQLSSSDDAHSELKASLLFGAEDKALQHNPNAVQSDLDRTAKSNANECTHFHAVLEHLQTENEALKEKLNRSEEKNSDLHQQMESMGGHLDLYKIGENEKVNRLKLLEEELLTINDMRSREKEESRMKIEELECSLADSSRQINDVVQREKVLVERHKIQIDELVSSSVSKDVQIKELNSSLASVRQDFEGINPSLLTCKALIKTLESELADEKLAHQTHKKSWEVERRTLNGLNESIQKENKALQTKCADLNAQLTLSGTRTESVKSESARSLSEISKQLSDAQEQLNVRKIDSDSLMDRLIKLEDESSSLKEELYNAKAEIDSLNKTIFELGRENQSLQILREKVASRQWTKDDDAQVCSKCRREFTVSNRRHHCRNCGNVFCHVCSSNRAPTVANKDPVRVCNACFTEIMAHKPP